MRTTLTLEPDVESLIREAVYRSGKTFKQAVNDALRTALAPAPTVKPERFVFPTYESGKPLVDLTKGLSLSAELEDLETIAKLERLEREAHEDS